MTPFLLALLLSCNLDAPPAYDVRVYDHWTAADVDGDGEIDLVATAANEVTVAYGTVGDAFEPPRAVAAIPLGHAVTVADVDGDRLADILVMRAEPPRGTVLLRNRGSRTFDAPVQVLPETANLPLPVDIDGDGDLDLAAPAFDAAIVTALNDGRGVFTAGPRSPTGLFVATLRPGDFNGDGRLDFLTYDFSGNARVFRGDGAGLFTLLQPLDLPQDAFILTAGDLNGDRYTDVIVPEPRASRIRIHFGTQAGLDPPVTVEVPPMVRHAQLVDLDADGDNDVLVFSSGATGGAAFLNDGRGNLTKGPDLPGSIADMGVLLRDTNRDGIADLIFGAGGLRGTIAVVRGLGGGRFHAPARTTIGAERFLHLADIDGNGAGDVLAIDRNPTILTITYDDGRSEQVVIPETNSGIFPIEATNAPGLELVIGEKDLLTVLERRFGQWNAVMTIAGTGVPRDVVAADARHLAVTWLQDRGAAIETYVLALPDVPRWRAELAPSIIFSTLPRDFTGDGINDLLVTGSGTWPGIPHDFTPLRNGYLSLFAGRGDGTFGDERRILANESLVPADAGDFDGDGDLDIVIGMQRGGNVVVLRNDGRGGFGAPEVIEEETERNIVRYAAGDLNGDGVDDLVTSVGSITLTLRLGTPDGFVTRPQVFGRGHTPSITRGRLSLLGFNALTTIGITCEEGRRRAAGR